MNPTTSQDALSQLQQTQSGAKSASDILANQRNQFGVQGAEDTVKGLRGAITSTTRLLNNIAPSVMGRTSTSLVNNSQATRQIANEQQPVAQNLSQQTQDLNTANEDYGRAQSRASEAAGMEYGDQQNKLSYMQNLYNTLFGREQAASQREAEERSRAEQARQFNESLALQRSKSSGGGGGVNLGGLLGGGKDTGPVWSNNGADNQFRDSAGRGITAYQYAQQKGLGYRDLLSKMAESGDKNAATALQYVGDNGVFGSAPRSLSGVLGAVGAKGNYV